VRIVTKADAGQWIKATNAVETSMAKAATLAMRDTGKLAVKNGRAAISAAGFSSTWQKSLRAINKPASGYVLNPAVYIHTTINYADVFQTGRTIAGNPYLWLPLPAVPPMPGSGVSKFGGVIGRPHMTPGQYVRLVGPLVTIRRPNGLPMLGAVVKKRSTRARQSGKAPTRKRLRETFLRKRFGEGADVTEVIPMFVAVSVVAIPKKFDIKAATQDAFDRFDEFYDKHLKPQDGP
jgi:hypothetical protein